MVRLVVRWSEIQKVSDFGGRVAYNQIYRLPWWTSTASVQDSPRNRGAVNPVKESTSTEPPLFRNSVFFSGELDGTALEGDIYLHTHRVADIAYNTTLSVLISLYYPKDLL